MKINKNLTGHLFLPAVILCVLIIILNQNYSDDKFNSIKKLTIGKIKTVDYGNRRTDGYISYEFIVNGQWIEGKDPRNPAWPKYIREEKPKIGKYYRVEYNPTNLNKSKIIIVKKYLNPNEIKRLTE